MKEKAKHLISSIRLQDVFSVLFRGNLQNPSLDSLAGKRWTKTTAGQPRCREYTSSALDDLGVVPLPCRY
jgi:hypothetical protein